MEEKSMKSKRILSLVLVLSVIFSSMSVYALDGNITYDTDVNKEGVKSEYTVKDLGTGSYEAIDASKGNLKASESVNSLRIVQVEEDIFKAVDAESIAKDEMFLKVKENTFQKVKKVDLGVVNKENVEDIISKHKIKKEIANDLRKMAELSENENVETGAILYTAAGKLASPTYYVGYNGWHYADEVLYNYQRSPWKEVEDGADLENAANVILQTIMDSIIGASEYSQIGYVFTLQDLFSSVFTVFPCSYGDWWQVQVYEQKWRKYTSIDIHWDGIYTVRAMSDRGSASFYHKVYDQSENIESTKQSSTTAYKLINYDDLDVKAYQYSGPWDAAYYERVNLWRLSTYYWIQSITA